MHKINADKRKSKEGITLIALIITIIVMLILVGVTITVAMQGGLFDTAREGAKDTEIEADREILQGAVVGALNVETGEIESGQRILDNLPKYWTVEEEGAYKCTSPNKNVFKVDKKGKIESSRGISLNIGKISLELKEGEIATAEITATLNEIEGEISWSNSNNDIATINTTKGNTITVTGIGVGETRITATCGNYSASCIIIVSNAIEIGSYVEYDISYIDIYTGYEFTKTDGWRYIGKDEEGNHLIVSTGIPGILYYSYSTNIGNTVDGGGNSWWATKAEISAESTPEIYRTGKGYDYSVDNGDPNKYVAYGLRYKFTSIPFSYQASGTSVSIANTGIYRKVGSYTEETLPADAFKASGVKIVDVHNLTLAELNRARNLADTATTGTASKDGATGLFYLRDLATENAEYGYTASTEPWYWLASPYAGGRESRVHCERQQHCWHHQ